jgi:predicted MPP superfamily phosphohydrolase
MGGVTGSSGLRGRAGQIRAGVRRLLPPVARGLRAAAPPPLRRWAARIAVAFTGAALGLMLGAHTTAKVGPFDANLSLRPSLSGGSVVRIPPLGSLELRTHDGPLRLDVELQRLRQTEAQELLRDPGRLQGIGDEASHDVRDAVTWLGIKAALCALAGAGALSLVVYRRRLREPFVAAGMTVVFLGVTAGGAYGSWRPEAISEPKYTGLLTNAPALVGDARTIVNRFDAYREELAGLITNVSKLYAATTTLPTFRPTDTTIRVLHVSDLHLSPTAYSVIKSVVQQFKVDVVVDTGDLTDWGSEPETRFVQGIRSLGVPYVYVRGNHDSARTATAVRSQPNAIVLSGGQPVTVKGLTFAGTGDPRFTPDKETRDDDASAEKVQSAGEELARIVQYLPKPPDVTLLHDPLSAIPLKDKVPLVLAGHVHKKEAERLGNTLVLVEGSTGGAGLRGLQGEEPTPIECSVLYFDSKTHALQAYDDLTLGGLGQTEATIERHLVGKEHQAGGG